MDSPHCLAGKSLLGVFLGRLIFIIYCAFIVYFAFQLKFSFFNSVKSFNSNIHFSSLSIQLFDHYAIVNLIIV
jgi:hypothetical protein